jgi:hypothetical protein
MISFEGKAEYINVYVTFIKQNHWAEFLNTLEEKYL